MGRLRCNQASQYGCTDLAWFLVGHGVGVTAQGKDGTTLLHSTDSIPGNDRGRKGLVSFPRNRLISHNCAYGKLIPNWPPPHAAEK